MNSFPSNSILLGRKYVAPDGTSVYAWPAEDRRFLLLLQDALNLSPSADSSSGGIPKGGVVFVSLQDPDAANQVLGELRETSPDIMVGAVGEGHCKLADICVAGEVELLQKALLKLASGNMDSPLKQRLVRIAALSAAAALIVGAGWYLRKNQSSPHGIDWKKKAKLPPIAANGEQLKPSPEVKEPAPSEPTGKKDSEKSSQLVVGGNIRYQHLVMAMPSAGSVAEVLATEGQTISAGMPLLKLRNPQLISKAEQFKSQREVIEGELSDLIAEHQRNSFHATEASAKLSTQAEVEVDALTKAIAKLEIEQSLLNAGLPDLNSGIVQYQTYIDNNPGAASTYRRPMLELQNQINKQNGLISQLAEEIDQLVNEIAAVEERVAAGQKQQLAIINASFQNEQQVIDGQIADLVKSEQQARNDAIVLVNAQVPGLVTSIRVTNGQEVGKGQPLMAIRRTDLAPEVIAYPKSLERIKTGMPVDITGVGVEFSAGGVVLELGSPENKPAVRIKLEDFNGMLPPEGAEVMVSPQLKK